MYGSLTQAVQALLHAVCIMSLKHFCLPVQVEEPLYFVDFLREPVVDDDTGEVVDAHPSFYESVPGGLPDIRARVEALQQKFNEESKVWQAYEDNPQDAHPQLAMIAAHPKWPHTQNGQSSIALLRHDACCAQRYPATAT